MTNKAVEQLKEEGWLHISNMENEEDGLFTFGHLNGYIFHHHFYSGKNKAYFKNKTSLPIYYKRNLQAEKEQREYFERAKKLEEDFSKFIQLGKSYIIFDKRNQNEIIGEGVIKDIDSDNELFYIESSDTNLSGYLPMEDVIDGHFVVKEKE